MKVKEGNRQEAQGNRDFSPVAFLLACCLLPIVCLLPSCHTPLSDEERQMLYERAVALRIIEGLPPRDLTETPRRGGLGR